MPLSDQIRLRVARADVEIENAFSTSIAQWQRGNHASTEIDGDCVEHVSMTDGGLLHINGSLNTDINTGGHHEIIIAGNVASDVVIKCTDFCSLYVNGDFNGMIESADSAKIWINANCSGTIKTGKPSTNIRIGGDFSGNVEPLNKASLLYLTINGFAKNESLTNISQLGYTLFHAVVSESDVKPGMYPAEGYQKISGGGNTLSRWTVESQYAG